MIEKIKTLIIKFFTENIVLKFSSLFLSIFLWFIVMNINNPTEIRTFSVELTLTNLSILEENSLVLLNSEEVENQKVQIKVKGTRQALSELNKTENKEQITAYLNLNQFKYLTSLETSDFFSANIEVSLPNLSYSYEISNINPINISLNLDKKSTISKKINVKKIGSLSNNYISTESSLSSEYVQITGASSILEKIESVFIEVNIDNATTDVEAIAYPIAYDSDGNKIESITFYPETISAVTSIYKKVNIEVLEPKLVGELEENYEISNISYEPDSFYIYISQDLENKINTKVSPIVDISNISENKTYTFNIKDFFDDKYDIYYESQNQISVLIEVEENKSLDVSLKTSEIELNNIPEEYEVQILEEEIIFTLVGKKSDLESIDTSEIKVSVDLENLSKGEESFKLDFKLPENISLKEDVYITVSNNIQQE